jgi:hypothetical protein
LTWTWPWLRLGASACGCSWLANSTALSDHVIGHVLHLLGRAAQHRHLHAAFMVEMDMQRGERQVVMLVEGIDQPFRQLARMVVVDIDQRRDAVRRAAAFRRRLAQPRSRQVADRFRAILVAAQRDQPVELDHEVVVEGDGHALHGASGTSA